ncbi:MAG TPA: metal-sulfur cluster assembly factor [Puia sp.]|uniref:metal-sulfur cluster assembly factor n=1 Tax=Puia sp. TaxID=2045100 RepID=UPI002BEA9339|nr:metal-sulfur cluster assembly factor [Puia sp.]HVU94326.1 metal-sulfur cluster assembly factor [Puia sp.]
MNVTTNNDLQCTIALAALENVIDPEIGLNVVDLGLIYRIDFDAPGPGISVLMTLTTPFCPMGDAITSAVEQVLQETFAAARITVKLSFDQPWSHDRISDNGKKFLNS